VSDEEWAFVAPYLTLMTTDAPQREHSLREYQGALYPHFMVIYEQRTTEQEANL